MYKGLWTGVNVAIKFAKSSSPEALNIAAKEAILSRFVSHPNVVQVRPICELRVDPVSDEQLLNRLLPTT